MLSLVELERVAEVISQCLLGSKVERWLEPERGRLAVTLYHREADEARKLVLGIDARPQVAHLGRLAKMPPAPDSMPAFAAYCRAHLGRARLESASIRAGDRQLELGFEAQAGRFSLLLSIFGRRSNLYLLDPSGRLVQALRPLADTRPELELGGPYLDPGRPAPRAGEDRFQGIEGMALLDAIGARYAADSEERSNAEQKRQLLRAVKKARKSTERRVGRLEAELAEAELTDRLARQGELLKSNLSRVRPGAASLQVEDWETGKPVEIDLNPKLSAKANLEAIFKRYQKLLRRLTKAGGQIDAAREGLEGLDALAQEIEGAEDLTTIAMRDDVRALLGRQASRAGSALVAVTPKPPSVYRNLPRRLHPRRYASIDDLEIWVGRSDEGNDVLTTRLARGFDLFFHLDGAPGSHVILRTEGRADPPPESVLDACELAVHFSRQKNVGRADVHVVPIKHVKKPKGAKRGLVFVTGGKSIHLRREAARLERLLNARIED
jgi:predicted ribosome quality control (RQC) complex YloA/Tae2 family protein